MNFPWLSPTENWLTEVEVEVTLRLTVSQSVSLGVEPHLGLMTRYVFITLWQLRTCFSEAPSQTRGRVCLLCMLLVLASIVVLGLESLWSRDDILLSQISDFPFRRLLRLAGSRWRYSNPPPHGFWLQNCYLYRLRTDHPQKTHQLLSNVYHVLLSGASTHALPSNGLPIFAHSLLWYVFTGLLSS
jgi:hypothetical protein